MDSKFGWNPKVGDRVEGVGAHGGTGAFGTVVKRRRDGFVIEWDTRTSPSGVVQGGRSVHQSYGFRKVEEKPCPMGCVDGWVTPKVDSFRFFEQNEGRKVGCPIHPPKEGTR